MDIGDIVVRRSYGRDITFKIIDIRRKDEKEVYYLKGINLRIIADSPIEDLELVTLNSIGDKEKIMTRMVNASIKKIIYSRSELRRIDIKKTNRFQKVVEENGLFFGRPGKILHIDGDADYMENCLKVYKQLSLEVVGKVISEKEQSNAVVDLVKENKPDIVVITGHDAIIKGTTDFMNIDNYKNSRYYVDSVTALRNYKSGYDDLVIFAGACQSCYEALLDAGANFTKLQQFRGKRVWRFYFFL